MICPSNSTADLLTGVQYAAENASVISRSWGTSESGMASEEAAVTQYFAGTGKTFVAATGDSGFGVQWPSTDPHVIAVGGSSLQTDLLGNRSSETAWSGSGGGVTGFQSAVSQSHWSAHCAQKVSALG